MSWQKDLLRWYEKQARDLPWRRTKDPYAIWVSEIMLQQTTVEVVIPYYERFLARFPGITDLAQATEEEVLALWSGLGYYSRVRNLRHSARWLVQNRNGKIPQELDELMTLKGIGRYTAGAIRSIAYEKKAPIVDGNVIRVLSRLYAMEEDPKSTSGQKVFWKKAEEILPDSSFGNFNQALMELGACVCTPDRPLCLLCPVRTQCQACHAGCVSSYPRMMKKNVYESIQLSSAIVMTGKKIYMVRRPDQGVLKNLWELPTVEGPVSTLLQVWSFEAETIFPEVRHSILNKRLRVVPVLCRPLKKLSEREDRRWVRLDELDKLATSSMNMKIVAIFQKTGART